MALSPTASRKLNPFQRRFVIEYLKDENATNAAKRAGYKARSAHAQGARLLKHPDVAKEIDRQLKAQETRTLATADRIIAGMAQIAFADVRKLYKPNGEMLPPAEWPDEIALAVSAVDVDELFEMEGEGRDRKRVQVGVTRKVKLCDKNKALENIARHLKLLIERHEVSGRDGKPIDVTAVGVDLSALSVADLKKIVNAL